MNCIRRAGLATVVALAIFLSASAACALEYDDVIGLARQGVSDRTIVELIVKDGRAFEMNDDEIQQLTDAGVDQVVIDAMLDPVAGQDWLDGRAADRYDEDGIPIGDGSSGSGGYSTSLDRAYQSGYDDGRSTALVYSFGYYYGPLARYYYCDPFYYPFWSAGYASSYWPSYYAFSFRPSYDWYYAYPYNFYNYNSYYCYTYYDPGYYAHQGYTVQPGYGRTVWDNGPRWRDGGLPPGGGARFDGRTDGVRSRLLAGKFVDAERGVGRPAAPPIVRLAPVTREVKRTGDPTGDRLLGNRTGTRRDLVAGTRIGNGRVIREVSPENPGEPRRVTRAANPPRSPGAYEGLGDRLRNSPPRQYTERGRMAREGRTMRAAPQGGIARGRVRGDEPGRDSGRTAGPPRGVVRASEARDPDPARAPARPERAPEVEGTKAPARASDGPRGEAQSVRPSSPARGEDDDSNRGARRIR